MNFDIEFSLNIFILKAILGWIGRIIAYGVRAILKRVLINTAQQTVLLEDSATEEAAKDSCRIT